MKNFAVYINDVFQYSFPAYSHQDARQRAVANYGTTTAIIEIRELVPMTLEEFMGVTPKEI